MLLGLSSTDARQSRNSCVQENPVRQSANACVHFLSRRPGSATIKVIQHLLRLTVAVKILTFTQNAGIRFKAGIVRITLLFDKRPKWVSGFWLPGAIITTRAKSSAVGETLFPLQNVSLRLRLLCVNACHPATISALPRRVCRCDPAYRLTDPQ